MQLHLATARTRTPQQIVAAATADARRAVNVLIEHNAVAELTGIASLFIDGELSPPRSQPTPAPEARTPRRRG